MLGSFGVGKTSLTRRFVDDSFSEKYLTTIGVKIEEKAIEVDGSFITLVIWDIHGQDEFETVGSSYIRSSAGVFLVSDLTRLHTVDTALQLYEMSLEQLQDAYYVALFNKADLVESFDEAEFAQSKFKELGIPVFFTSAKKGNGVNEAFSTMARNFIHK